jgi:hypothetical protein
MINAEDFGKAGKKYHFDGLGKRMILKWILKI